jgi:hypothetical protein
MRRTARVVMASLLTTSALAGAACGGGDKDDDAAAGGLFGDAATQEPSSADEAAVEEGSAVEEGRVTIGETVWYAGFKFELGDAALAPSENAVDIEGNPDPTVGQLTIDAVVENLGEDDAAPDQSQIYVEQAGSPLDLDPFAYEGLPVVPGGSTANAEIVFDGLPGDFSLDNAALVFGDGAVHQARVPLGGGGETVTLEPLDVVPGPGGQAGEISFSVTGGQLIYGDSAFHIQLESDTALLVVEYEITGSPNLWAGSGGAVVGFGGVRLVLPDGTSVSDTVTGGSSNEILQPSATIEGMIARYEIPADVRGSFQLAMRGRFGSGCCEDVEGMAALELPD